MDETCAEAVFHWVSSFVQFLSLWFLLSLTLSLCLVVDCVLLSKFACLSAYIRRHNMLWMHTSSIFILCSQEPKLQRKSILLLWTIRSRWLLSCKPDEILVTPARQRTPSVASPASANACLNVARVKNQLLVVWLAAKMRMQPGTWHKKVAF